MSFLNMLRKDEAIEQIIRYIHGFESAPNWNTWYVGITDDPRQSLYEEHKALISKSITVSVDSVATARSVESFLIARYGMDGTPGDGNNPRYVYAFKKSLNTEPPL